MGFISRLMDKSPLSQIKRGMAATDAEKLLADDYRVVSDFCNGVDQWEVWYRDGQLSYPVGEIFLVDGKVHSIDEHLCRPFSGDAVDFAEALYQALISLSPSKEKQGKTVTEFKVVMEKCSPTGAQQTDIGIWSGDAGIGIHVWIHDQGTRRLVLKKCR
jgi:hypothetical protein